MMCSRPRVHTRCPRLGRSQPPVGSVLVSKSLSSLIYAAGDPERALSLPAAAANLSAASKCTEPFTFCHHCFVCRLATSDAAVWLQSHKMQDAVPPRRGPHQAAPEQKATGGKSLRQG